MVGHSARPAPAAHRRGAPGDRHHSPLLTSACGSNNCLDFNTEPTFQQFAFKCVVRELPEVFNRTAGLHFNVHLKNFKKPFHVDSFI